MVARLVSSLDLLGLLTSQFEFSESEIRTAIGEETLKEIEEAARRLKLLVEVGS